MPVLTCSTQSAPEAPKEEAAAAPAAEETPAEAPKVEEPVVAVAETVKET